MGRIEETFRALASSTPKRKALVAYLCVGDPSVEASIELSLAAVEAGADMLELGVPFSDPAADGPAIAEASERALALGGGLVPTLKAAAAIRARTNVPIVLFGYYNPLFVHGEAKLVSEAKAAGIDGLLVVDLPVDEPALLRRECARNGLALVPLISPTTSDTRLETFRAAFDATPPGFLYCVSVAGVTGSATVPMKDAAARASLLRARLGVPAVVGFGIDTPDKAHQAGEHADGVVVGTAIVRAIHAENGISERIAAVKRVVGAIRDGLDRVERG